MKRYLLTIFFVFIFQLFCNTGKAQTDSSYSIIVAGHAYGAHEGGNIGLHPPFLEKLKQNVDSNTRYIFLTGDIVNYSTSESWQQVEQELSDIGVNSCYVMGNHDDNSIGHDVFQEKHGGIYYSFTSGNELYIVLNSTESDRSISPAQLEFLDNILTNTDSNWSRVFIFFHEVIWNSNEKYRLVRSNSRSRYDQMIYHSNFWNEVYPMLTALPDKEFYLFAGDVGGNPDAIAASYDKWENVTLISSGMGEVVDENYLKADILPDTVLFTLIPLNDEVEMHPIQWYNVPGAPMQIAGTTKLSLPAYNVKYEVTPVFNATGYLWNLSEGMHGGSDSTSILVDFDGSFQSGEISVRAVNDGFGISESVAVNVEADSLTSVDINELNSKLKLTQNENYIQIEFQSDKTEKAQLRFFDRTGRMLFSEEFDIKPGINSKRVTRNSDFGNFVIMELIFGNRRIARKIFAR